MTTNDSGLSLAIRTQADSPSRPVRVDSESSLPTHAATKGTGGKPGSAVVNDEAGKNPVSSAERICGTDVHREECHRASCTDSSPTLLTLIVDNYDSFTYSIVQYLAKINGVPPLVVKNNDFPSWEALKESLPKVDNVVISPGPGDPANADDFGISSAALQDASLPTLGICLGHQGLAHVFGGKVIRAPKPVHGRRSIVDFVEGYDLFRGIKQGATVLRYHSLVVEKASLPACLEVTCWTRDEQRLIMGMRHKQLPVHSVQFHPESIGTADGLRMLENFKEISLAWWKQNRRSTTGSARWEGVNALSTQLLRENRIGSLAIAEGVEAAIGGEKAAENKPEGLARGQIRTTREEKPQAEPPARESAVTAEARKAARREAEGLGERGAATAAVKGWVVNVAIVSRVRGHGTPEYEQQQQRPPMGAEGDSRSRNSVYDQSVVFEKFFAGEQVCFWLDSSSADERCAGVHARKRYSRRGCFSYMGGCSGPFAEAVEYYEKEKKAVVRDFTSMSETEVTLQQTNLFHLLATRLQRATGKATSIPGSRNTSGPRRSFRPNSNNRSGSKADITHRVGCSNDIQVRWWELCDGALKEVTGETSLCCGGGLEMSTGTPSHDDTVKASEADAHAGATTCTGQHARSSIIQHASSRRLPQFGFLGGYVGFFGYEVRRLVESYEGTTSPILAPLAALTSAAAGRRGSRFKSSTNAKKPTDKVYSQGCDPACKERPSDADADDNNRPTIISDARQDDHAEKLKIYEFTEERRANAAGRHAEENGKVAERVEMAAEDEGKFVEDEHAKETHTQQDQQPKYRIGQACDAVWIFADRLVAFDLENNTAYLLWLTLPPHAAAPDVGGMEEMNNQPGCNSSCDERAETARSSASTGLGKLPYGGYDKKAMAYISSHWPFPTTASSVSHLSSPAESYSPPSLSPSDLTGKCMMEPIGEAAAAEKEGGKNVLLQMPATCPCDKEAGYSCSALESTQLAWATQTLQQLLHFDGDMSLPRAAPAGEMSETERKERGENSAVGSKTEKGRNAGKVEDAAAAVGRDSAGREESSSGDIAEGRTPTEAAERRERSEREIERQGGAREDAELKKRKTTEERRQEEDKVDDEKSTTATGEVQEEHRKKAKEGKDLEEREVKEKEAKPKETVAKVSRAPPPSSLRVGVALEQAMPSTCTGATTSCSSASLFEHSSSSTPEPLERTRWLLQPRDTKDQYLEKINAVFNFINSGDAYEMCLTTEFSGSVALQTADLFAFYVLLRKRNPTPFSVFFRYQPQTKFLGNRNNLRNEEKENKSSISCNTQEESCPAFGIGAPSLSPAAASHSRCPTTVGASFPVAASNFPAEAATACPSFTICCASPELFLLLDKEGWLESRPIKGTRPRGKTAVTDAALARDLATSEKDAAENMMVVDVSRSDLGKVSVPGTVCVPELMVVESYSHMHQLVSTIRGKLRPELSFFDAVAAAFPGASMTGAPKKRVMKLLSELEQRERGLYSGAIGFLSVDRQAALNIAIRTLIFFDDEDRVTPSVSTKQEKIMRATFGTGGAIIAASNPEEEVEEMQLKAESVLSLLHEFLSSSRLSSAPYDRGNSDCASARHVVYTSG